jgi:hypothetical protein
MNNPIAPLGTRPCVRITRVVRVQYRVEWEYDGHVFYYDEATGAEYLATRKRRARFVVGRAVAYRMAAMRLIFSRRDRYAQERNEKGHLTTCRLCAESPSHGPEDVPLCRYHDEYKFVPLRDRLARWLQWRDSAIEARRPVQPDSLPERAGRRVRGGRKAQ